MERRELEEIERFFAGAGHRTPLAYYGLPEDAPAEAVDAAIKKRRTWAQGQQANPKYRAEALFIIKSNAMLRRLLLDERELYTEHFGAGGNPKLQELNELIRRLYADGGWTGSTDAAVRLHGRKLEIEEGLVEARLQAIARELGLTRQGDEDLGALANVDVYELLQVEQGADAATIEAAYRARYRWARQLRDLEKSSRIVAMLDAAWRIVRDPDRRARYDATRGEVHEATEEVGRENVSLHELLRTPASPEPERSSQSMLDAVRSSARLGGSDPAPSAAPSPPPLRMAHAEPPPFKPPSPSPNLTGRPVAAPPRPVAPPVSPPPVARPSGSGEGEAPVPNISGRTIGLAEGPQMVRDRAPKLVVPAKSPVRLQLPRSRPFAWMLRVQNTGQGRMPGRIVSDQPWMVPVRDWLDPQSREQEIPIELKPTLLSGNAGEGTLTIVTDHGERRTVQFEVTRTNYVGPLLGLLVVVGLGGLGWFGWAQWQAAHPPPVAAVAHVHFVPPAEVVTVDGKAAAHGAAADLAPPVRGTPFALHASAAGVGAVDQQVTVGDVAFELTVTLPAEDTMAWAPAGLPVTPLAPAAADVLAEKTVELGGCFADGAARDATVSFTLHVAADGKARGLELASPEADVGAARPCIVPIVKELSFPGVTGPRADGTFPMVLRVGR